MREVSIVGVGSTPFGKMPDRSIQHLAIEAAVAAIRDAGPLSSGRVEGDAATQGTRVELTAYDGDAPVLRAMI